MRQGSPRRSSACAIADPPLIDTLPPVSRLALAYAPARTKAAWLCLLALDARLSGVVLRAREPLLGQIRLAWWRDRLAEPLDKHPRGEPLLRLLPAWQGRHGDLVALVDGWEALLCGEGAPDEAALAAFAEGRGAACAALAELLGEAADRPARMGRGWGLGDLAGELAPLADREAVRRLGEAQDWRTGRLARPLRPLGVLHGLARREAAGRPLRGMSAFAASIRLGLLGL